MADEKITANDIRNSLQQYYADPEWTLMFEVGNGTGGTLRRHADGVAMNMYPSRGYEIRGFEIKVSRSDLKHEIEQAEKAEAVCQYCDTWFLVVPKGLTKDIQIPLPWGIIEYCDEGKLRIKKQAEKLQRETLPVQFVAGMLRAQQRTSRQDVAKRVESELQSRKEIWQKHKTWEMDRLRDDNERMVKKLTEVKEQTGINLLDWVPTSEIVAKLQAVSAVYDLEGTFRQLQYMHSTAQRVLTEIENVKNNLNMEELFPERSGTR